MAEYDYDLFISHASEDKDGFVRALVEERVGRGLHVWFDDAELQVGDTLTKRIDEGLARSRWCCRSESGLFQEELAANRTRCSRQHRDSDGHVVVLPIWLDVSHAEVETYSPMLASKYALQSSDGVEAAAEKLERRVRGGAAASTATEPANSALQPHLLRGRIFPSSYASIMRSDERGLVCRVALAAAAPTDPEPRFRSSEQDLFEETLEESSLRGSSVWDDDARPSATRHFPLETRRTDQELGHDCLSPSDQNDRRRLDGRGSRSDLLEACAAVPGLPAG